MDTTDFSHKYFSRTAFFSNSISSDCFLSIAI
jgi:hypothetical protein